MMTATIIIIILITVIIILAIAVIVATIRIVVAIHHRAVAQVTALAHLIDKPLNKADCIRYNQQYCFVAKKPSINAGLSTKVPSKIFKRIFQIVLFPCV